MEGMKKYLLEYYSAISGHIEAKDRRTSQYKNKILLDGKRIYDERINLCQYTPHNTIKLCEEFREICPLFYFVYHEHKNSSDEFNWCSIYWFIIEVMDSLYLSSILTLQREILNFLGFPVLSTHKENLNKINNLKQLSSLNDDAQDKVEIKSYIDVSS